MDALIAHQGEVDAVIAGLLRPLVDQELSVVVYDMTTIRAAGLSQQNGELRQFGMAKEALVTRQFMLGVVQTADCLPIFHDVFTGNTAEVNTLKPTLDKVLARFPVRRVIVVADRGLLSTDNLDELATMRLPGGEPLGFILAVPGRRYSEFMDLLTPFHGEHCAEAHAEVVGETRWKDLRLVIAHDPLAAVEKTQQRDQTIDALEARARAWTGKLDAHRMQARPAVAASSPMAVRGRVSTARSAKRIWRRSSGLI